MNLFIWIRSAQVYMHLAFHFFFKLFFFLLFLLSSNCYQCLLWGCFVSPLSRSCPDSSFTISAVLGVWKSVTKLTWVTYKSKLAKTKGSVMKKVPPLRCKHFVASPWCLTFSHLTSFSGLVLHSGCIFLLGKDIIIKTGERRENHWVAHEQLIILKFHFCN